ncbi:MAG TPA: SCO family protein [Candidatus Azoamicus sp. OHIO1]
MLKILVEVGLFFWFLLPVFSMPVSLPEDSIYNLNVELIEKDGKSVMFSDLKDKIQIFAMIYTNCKTICPIIISNMKFIEKIIPNDVINDVGFTLISLDPDRDTTSNLEKFFLEKRLNSNRWRLFKASKSDTMKIALAVGIKYRREKGDEYTHSNLIVVLDKSGVIKLHHQGLDKSYSNFVKIVMSLK